MRACFPSDVKSEIATPRSESGRMGPRKQSSLTDKTEMVDGSSRSSFFAGSTY